MELIMVTSILSLASLLTSIILISMLLNTWRKNKLLTSSLEALRKEIDNAEEETEIYKKNLSLIKNENLQLTKSEKKNKSLITRLKTEVKDLNLSNLSKQSKISNEELKRENSYENYKIQCTTLTKQIKEIVEENKIEKKQIEAMWLTKVSRLEEALSSVERQKKDIEKTIKGKDQDLEKLKEKQRNLLTRMKKVDPKEILIAKKRLKSHIHLYQVIKSQKDLLEDRNKNFEIIVTLLSQWICQRHGTKELIPNQLGELIEKAIAITKLQKKVDTEFDKLDDPLMGASNFGFDSRIQKQEKSPTLN